METKRYATADVKSAVEADDAFPGSFEVTLSTDSLDRDGEVVEAKCFGALPDHITFDVDHGLSVETTVGSGAPFYDMAGNLKVKGTYCSDPFSQLVRTKVKEGHIRTASVAYMTKRRQVKDGKPHITSAELLNGSFVPVPANRDAIVTAAKSLKAGARNSTTDQGRLQEIHDLAVENGADCSMATKSHKPGRARLKSIVGSVEALQDRVNDALADAYAAEWGYWGWLRGVVPSGDGGGSVVFQSSGIGDGYESATYSQDYTDDGAVVTLVGDPAEVDIHEIVVPDADADRGAGAKTSPKPATKEADAQGAADHELTDDEKAELDLHLRGIRALSNTVA